MNGPIGAPEPWHPVSCPFCGNALQDGVFHACREMRESGYTVATVVEPEAWPRLLPKLAAWAIVVLAAVIAAYLGAYLLNSLGVGCPTPS